MFELQHRDRELLNKMGISEKNLYDQLKLLKDGVPYIELVEPCTIQKGIKTLDDINWAECINVYNENLSKIKPVKFVPASGAASRMFALLSKVHSDYDKFREKIEYGHKDSEISTFHEFINNIRSFAFFDDLEEVVKKEGLEINDLVKNKEYHLILEYLLTDKGLDYLKCPKALIKFHNYDNEARTAFEEHIAEAGSYCKTTDGVARVQFTILPEHEDKFNKYLESQLIRHEKEGIKLEISFSFQSPDTDIIAVDFNDVPLRDEHGNLIFRPGGHGALIKNLGDLDGDVIFVKNIDNIVPDRLKVDTNMFKKALGGYLLELKQTMDSYLKMIDDGTIIDTQIENAMEFIEDKLEIKIPSYLAKQSTGLKQEFIVQTFNRPLRICGVVKNVGEPGGGPFWVRDIEGKITKQIVESAQVNFDDPVQDGIWKSSTHFNPVDLVCSIYDYKGNKFDLLKYVDMNTVFITKKSKDGIDLKAMELPGLWNGSMARWNTVFVEVPLITFNPVKTVFDLLKPEHQPGC